MTVKPIVLYNENQEALRKKSRPVKVITRRIKTLIKDLKDTLLERPDGIGLAAPQINVHRRVVLVRLGSRGEDDGELGPPIALINPEIVEAKNPERDFDGCLSFPGLFAETVRPHYLRVTGLNEGGKRFDRIFEGFDAVLVHHEIDHLNGVLFIDRITSVDDLYYVRENDEGELVRVPVSAES